MTANDARAERALQKEAGRAGILEAAARAIAVHGFHGMSMRELSQETGRGLASLYNYFSSKEELLFALQAGAFESLIESADAALQGIADPLERLYAFIVNHVRYFLAHPDVMRVLVHEAQALEGEARHRVRALKEHYFEMGRALVGAVVPPGCPGVASAVPLDPMELERATYSLFGMLNWVYGWYEPERHGSVQDVARTLYRVALCGVTARCPVATEHAELGARVARLPAPSPIRPLVLQGGGS